MCTCSHTHKHAHTHSPSDALVCVCVCVGRGRAEGSRCFLISSSKECIEKEKINMFKEKMVEEAIIQLQSGPTNLSNKVLHFHRMF